MMTHHHDCELISLAGEGLTGRDFATSFRNAKDFRTWVEIWVLTKSPAVIRKQDYFGAVYELATISMTSEEGLGKVATIKGSFHPFFFNNFFFEHFCSYKYNYLFR